MELNMVLNVVPNLVLNSISSPYLLVTSFLSCNPSLYKSSHHKQDSMIATSKIFHFSLQMQIVKSYNFHLKSYNKLLKHTYSNIFGNF